MAGVLAVVAHQGGWDEILLVGGPIVLIIGVLAIAKRRVDRVHAAREVDDEIDGEVSDDAAPGGAASTS